MYVFIAIVFHFASSLLPSSFAQFDPNCFGVRRPLVHLFEWRWSDIADECERFLSKKGFCGVQVSPPNENRIVMNSAKQRPWWERYQPVSYKLITRSGDEAAFTDMVKRCNNVGVRIYVDAVINHMAGDDAGEGTGTGGTKFNTQTLDFPGVPYSSSDFHAKGSECKSNSGRIERYNDSSQVRNCRLEGLTDLNQGKDSVRQKIADYMNRLISLGVAGFRVDAAKHMTPADLQAIIGMLTTLNTAWFTSGSKPFVYQEVIDLGNEPIKSSEYYAFARVTEFNYGSYLSKAFSGQTQLKNFKTFGQGWGYLMPEKAALVFIDNHDNQRGHGAGGTILNFFSPRQYKMAVTFMLSWPYGVAQVMSSYKWDRNFQGPDDLNNWIGPPHDSNYNTNAVTINGDGTCGNGWVCEHRWRPITNMAAFRNTAGDEPVANWWDDGDNQIAFSRGSKAFFAMNAGSKQMSVTLQTGMKPGQYCDVISGELSADGTSCTGKTILVASDGKASISIPNTAYDPMIAIHIDSKVVPNNQRTVIFIQYNNAAATDNLFLRGGVSSSRRPVCATSASACWLPINYSQVSYTGTNYAAYNTWAQGDTYLDWAGAESTQGTYQAKKADGSPTVRTTNAPTTDANYNSLNSYGANYWMLDVNMDCSMTDNGWFEVKGFLNGKWESDIKQSVTCGGSASLATPYLTNNHVAKCGYKNVFVWGNTSCQIDRF